MPSSTLSRVVLARRSLQVLGEQAICLRFRLSVLLSGGRTVAVQPETQMVWSIVDWVTAGFSTQ